MIFYKDKFKELREQRGLSLAEVGTACGVSQSMVSRWETDEKSSPRPNKIQKIAKCLQCAPEDIAKFGDIEITMDHVQEVRERYISEFGADIYDELAAIRLQKRNLKHLGNKIGPQAEQDDARARYEKAIEEARMQICKNIIQGQDPMLKIVLDIWPRLSPGTKGELIDFIERRKNG